VSNPSAPPATTPCQKCRRPVAVTAKRCTYCGTYRILAAPGTPEYEVERAAADADAKRVERQKALYQHGMGLGKSAAKPSLAARLREQSLPVKVVVMLVVVPLMMFVNPFKAFALAKEVFRP
jgi:hypothetical protein